MTEISNYKLTNMEESISYSVKFFLNYPVLFFLYGRMVDVVFF